MEQARSKPMDQRDYVKRLTAFAVWASAILSVLLFSGVAYSAPRAHRNVAVDRVYYRLIEVSVTTDVRVWPLEPATDPYLHVLSASTRKQVAESDDYASPQRYSRVKLAPGSYFRLSEQFDGSAAA